MRKRLALLLLLSSVMFLSSCSFSNSFVVINKSNAPVTVQYTLKVKGASLENLSQVPAKMALKEFENRDGEWRKLSRDEYAYEAEAGRVGVMVSPGEALLIDRPTYSGSNKDEETDSLNITSLRLTGANGTVQYDGLQARRQFQLAFKMTYTITYY